MLFWSAAQVKQLELQYASSTVQTSTGDIQITLGLYDQNLTLGLRSVVDWLLLLMCSCHIPGQLLHLSLSCHNRLLKQAARLAEMILLRSMLPMGCPKRRGVGDQPKMSPLKILSRPCLLHSFARS